MHLQVKLIKNMLVKTLNYVKDLEASMGDEHKSSKKEVKSPKHQPQPNVKEEKKEKKDKALTGTKKEGKVDKKQSSETKAAKPKPDHTDEVPTKKRTKKLYQDAPKKRHPYMLFGADLR